MNPKYIVVLCSCPDEAAARHIAATLVEERLAACVNRVSGVRSTYRWQDEIRDDAEVLLIAKTAFDRYPELELRLKALHPYEVPEIIALPIIAGAVDYLAWLGTGCDIDGAAGSAPLGKDRTP